VWLGTDRNEPIRTASGRPIAGKDVPGTAWHTFMVDATAGRPAQDFAPFRPIGTPPSDLPPDVDPRRQAASTAPTPAPTIAPMSPPSAPNGVPTPAPTAPSDEGSTCTLSAPCG
jgi:hypothetical protein